MSSGRTCPAGGFHAEVLALKEAGAAARGSVLYTTLEPCCHHGKTGPCTEVIVASGVSRVVVGCQDRNPLVSGRGIEALREAGLDVEIGVLEERCVEIARPFFTWIEQRRPYVVLKAAVTLDGRIATPGGDSKWISGERSRELVHRWRDRFDAVLVGAGTVKADDPSLTTRLVGKGGRDPIRVILDGGLSTEPESGVYRHTSDAPTWLVSTEDVDTVRLKKYLAQGFNVESLVLPGEDGSVDVGALMEALAARGIVSLLVEGGGVVNGALLAKGVVDEIRLFMAPKLLGGGRPWMMLSSDLVPRHVSQATPVQKVSMEQVGEDLLIRALLSRRDASIPEGRVSR